MKDDWLKKDFRSRQERLYQHRPYRPRKRTFERVVLPIILGFLIALPIILCLFGGELMKAAEKAYYSNFPKAITISVDGQNKTLETKAKTVADVLKEAKVQLGPKDRVQPSLKSEATNGLTITVYRVTETTEVATVDVPYHSYRIKDPTLQTGKTKLVSVGENGSSEITYKITLEDGAEVRRAVIKESAVKPVSDYVIAVGTGTGVETYETGDVFSNKIAITFDDGPSPSWTPKVLEILKENGIKATFFELGENVKEYPNVSKEILSQGHEIGDHTWDHASLITLAPPEIEAEIQDTSQVIKQATGQSPQFLRPPYGDWNEDVLNMIASKGMKTIMWSVDSEDWKTPGENIIIGNVNIEMGNGAIILFHDGPEGLDRSQTLAVLPGIIKNLKEQGYEFVTMSELLQPDLAEEGGAKYLASKVRMPVVFPWWSR